MKLFQSAQQKYLELPFEFAPSRELRVNNIMKEKVIMNIYKLKYLGLLFEFTHSGELIVGNIMKKKVILKLYFFVGSLKLWFPRHGRPFTQLSYNVTFTTAHRCTLTESEKQTAYYAQKECEVTQGYVCKRVFWSRSFAKIMC